MSHKVQAVPALSNALLHTLLSELEARLFELYQGRLAGMDWDQNQTRLARNLRREGILVG